MAYTRFDITICLISLVMVMVLMNLYTFLLFWRLKFEQRLSDMRSVDRERHTSKVIKVKSPMFGDVDGGGVSSVRFRVDPTDGGIRLLIPPDLSAETEYFESLKESILAKIRETDMLANQQKIESYGNRLRRALGRNSASGVEIVAAGGPNPNELWSKLDDWPDIDKLISQGSLGQILAFISQVKVSQATGSRRGTQLKLELLLDGGRLAFFKPAWYPRDVVMRGDPYGGKDRHFGEIAAFYLARLLGYSSGPLVVGRKLNLATEILPYSTSQLNSTFFKNSNGDLCFYGACLYCKKEDPVCADQNEIEGALVVLMNQKLKLFPNPWRRTYKKNEFATWERNMSFCDSVREQFKTRQRPELLLDIVAISVFDFLIGNGDRHHLDIFLTTEASSGHVRRLAVLDNGKSFGDSEEDYLDILAPLYQCCIIRHELYSVLKKFRGGLGKSFDSITVFDVLYPLLTPAHLAALDRRLNIVVATIELCHEREQ